MVTFYGKSGPSRLLIGTALYPSPAIMQDAIRASGAGIVTVSLRREAAGGKTGDAFWSLIRELGVTVLPNTAGCRSVREAVTTARLARELFATPWLPRSAYPATFSVGKAAVLTPRSPIWPA